MSVPSYSFRFLPLKLPNKEMNFSFTLLKLPNKREGRIFLKYSFLFLFGSFNRENGMGKKEHSFFSIPLKSQILIPLKLRGMRGNEIRFNDFFTKTPKIPLYIQLFILK